MIKEAVLIRTEVRDRSGRRLSKVDTRYPGCVVWSRRSAEAEGAAVVLSGWNVLIPTRDEIPADCLVVVRGKEYELFGNAYDAKRKGQIVQCRNVGQT